MCAISSLSPPASLCIDCACGQIVPAHSAWHTEASAPPQVVARVDDWVRKIKFLGDILCIGTHGGLLRLVDLSKRGLVVAELTGLSGEITALDFDGRRVIAGSAWACETPHSPVLVRALPVPVKAADSLTGLRARSNQRRRGDLGRGRRGRVQRRAGAKSGVNVHLRTPRGASTFPLTIPGNTHPHALQHGTLPFLGVLKRESSH